MGFKGVFIHTVVFSLLLSGSALARNFTIDIDNLYVEGTAIKGTATVDVKPRLSDIDGLMDVVLSVQETQSGLENLNGKMTDLNTSFEERLAGKANTSAFTDFRTEASGQFEAINSQLSTHAATQTQLNEALQTLTNRVAERESVSQNQTTQLDTLLTRTAGYEASQEALENRLSVEEAALAETQTDVADLKTEFRETAVDLKLATENNAVDIVQNRAAIQANTSATQSNRAAIEAQAAQVRATSDAIGDMDFSSTHYLQGSTSLTEAFRGMDRSVERLENEIGKVKKETRNGFASVAALTALVPNAKAANNTQISLGSGVYQGETGFALGAFHYVNDNILLNAGLSSAGADSTIAKFGITFSW